jgi:hypothetical protein
MAQHSVGQVLETVRDRAAREGVFGEITLGEGLLECEAKGSAEPAAYRVTEEDGRIWVSLVTSNRWLSESIEADLMHSGDKIEELIVDELVELGGEFDVKCEHYRSDDMLFTFRSSVPAGVDAGEGASQLLLAYEACFRNLGDMSESED